MCTVSGCERRAVSWKMCAKHKLFAENSSNERLEAQYALGLCATRGCSNPPTDGTTLCAGHLEKKMLLEMERRAQRRDAGLCPECGGSPAEGYIMCGDCIAIGNRFGRSARARNKADGVCINGRSHGPAVPGRACCEACLTRNRERAREQYQRRLVNRPAHQVVPHPNDPGEPGRASGLVPAGVGDLDDLADVDRDAASRDDELVPGVDQDRG